MVDSLKITGFYAYSGKEFLALNVKQTTSITGWERESNGLAKSDREKQKWFYWVLFPRDLRDKSRALDVGMDFVGSPMIFLETY